MFKNKFKIAKGENVEPFFYFNFMEAQKVKQIFHCIPNFIFSEHFTLLLMIIEKFWIDTTKLLYVLCVSVIELNKYIFTYFLLIM